METEHTTCSGKRLDSDLGNRKVHHGAKDSSFIPMECEQEVTSDAETIIYESQATCELHVQLTHLTDDIYKYIYIHMCGIVWNTWHSGCTIATMLLSIYGCFR